MFLMESGCELAASTTERVLERAPSQHSRMRECRLRVTPAPPPPRLRLNCLPKLLRSLRTYQQSLAVSELQLHTAIPAHGVRFSIQPKSDPPTAIVQDWTVGPDFRSFQFCEGYLAETTVEWKIANVDSIIVHFGDKFPEKEERWQAYAKDEPENDQQSIWHRSIAKWTM